MVLAYFTGPMVRRGRPPGSGSATKVNKKQVNTANTVQRGLLMHMAEDEEALRSAGHALIQKLARQKRKPKLLSDDTQLADLTPRSGQVLIEPTDF